MPPWLLSHGDLACALPEGPVIADGAVAVQGDTITAVGTRADLIARYPHSEEIDAGGGLIAPGLVNLHHHFYSALARGLDPGRATPDFDAILRVLWWRLDRALGPEEIRLSALISLAECIRWGVTTVFDHHASPSRVDGSLDLLAEAVTQAGLRSALCYELSDRNGAAEAAAGLRENLRFITQQDGDPLLRGMLGLHASFTVSDESLRAVARDRPAGAGCHVHLAEDRLDVEVSRKRYGASPLDRLIRHGLVDRHALLIHGVHLDDGELELIAEHGATLVHNPESNQNNGVGRLDLSRAESAGCKLGLGTDGMSSNMLASLRCAFLGLREAHQDPTLGFAAAPRLLAGNREMAQRTFGLPKLGVIEAGAPADLAVFDSPSPTPVHGRNLVGHLIYAVSQAPARHTICNGRFLLRDYLFQTLDPREVAHQARGVASDLWSRFTALE